MTYQVLKKLLCCVLVTSHVGAFATEGGAPPPRPVNQNPSSERPQKENTGNGDQLFEVEVDVVSSDSEKQDDAQATPAPAHQVDQWQVIVPTLHQSQDTSNAGGLRFNFANRTVPNMRGVLEECVNRGFSPDFWKKAPPEIWIYFPSKEYFEENSRVVAQQVLDQYVSVYGSKPRIRMAIANTPVNVEYLADELKHSVDQLIEYNPGQAEALGELKDVIDQSKLEAIRLETEQQKAEKVAWYRRSPNAGPHVSAVTSNRIRLYGAFARATALAGIRTWQFMPAFAMGPTQTAVAISAIVFDASVEIATAIFSQQIQTFFMKNPNLSFIQRQPWAPAWIKHPSVDSLFGLLTSGAWNTSFFVVARASIMQASQAAAMPGMGLAYPTYDSVWDSVKINSIGILTNWFWVKGYSLLKDKGWLSGATVNVFLQGLSATDLGIGVANSSSDPSIRNIRNYLLPLQWGVYLATFMAGMFAPINAKRIIMVHNQVVETAKAEAEAKLAKKKQKNPEAANDNKPFTVADIDWLTLEQSGLRSLWTIPEHDHDVEIGRVVSLMEKRRADAAKKAAKQRPKAGLFTRFAPFGRGGAAAAQKVDEACDTVLENAPTAEQINEADADGEQNAS